MGFGAIKKLPYLISGYYGFYAIAFIHGSILGPQTFLRPGRLVLFATPLVQHNLRFISYDADTQFYFIFLFRQERFLLNFHGKYCDYETFSTHLISNL